MTNRNGYTLDEAVSAEVRAEIARQGCTVSALAVELGYRRATLTSRVSGDTPFRPSELQAVAHALGTAASVLVARAEQALAPMSGSPVGGEAA